MLAPLVVFEQTPSPGPALAEPQWKRRSHERRTALSVHMCKVIAVQTQVDQDTALAVIMVQEERVSVSEGHGRLLHSHRPRHFHQRFPTTLIVMTLTRLVAR